jgi:hypothetical protein
VRLQPCRFRNVFVGRVQAMGGFLAGVAERLAQRPELERWLGKLLPIERTFAVDPRHFAQQLQGEVGTLVDRLGLFTCAWSAADTRG